MTNNCLITGCMQLQKENRNLEMLTGKLQDF